MINNQEIGPMLLFDSLFEFSMKHINYLREFSNKSADFPETIINQIKAFCGKMNFNENNHQMVVVTNALKNESKIIIICILYIYLLSLFI